MQYRVIFTEAARQDLKSLEKKLADRIILKIAFFGQQKDIRSFCKPLVGAGPKLFRFRIGEYRAIFRIDEDGEIQILKILRIRHRKDIYDL